MKKLKNGMILSLTALVLVLCGMLPTVTAKVEDYPADEKIYYEDMKTVQLFQKLNDTEKMYLLKNGIATAISEDRTRLKSENMLEIVESALATYLERGFIKGNISDFSMECEPQLYYSNREPNLSGIFWEIRMELRDDLGQGISIYLDDQTGKVLLISYECLEPIYEGDMLMYYVEMLYDDYQETMDWFSYYEDYGRETQEYVDAKIITYRMGDVVYGEIGIEFVMTENGFRINIEEF